MLYIYSRRTLYVCCLLLGPPAIQINYGPPLFLAQVLTGDSPDFGWTVKTQRAEGRRKGLTGKQLPGCRAIGETTRPAMTIGQVMVCLFFWCVIVNCICLGVLFSMYQDVVT